MQDYFRTGDYHLLIAGGVHDQPAGQWLARNYAARVWQFMDKLKENTGDTVIKGLDKDDLDLRKQIAKIEARIDKEARTPEGKEAKALRDLQKSIEAQLDEVEAR